jgi:hypothetical protein
MTKTMSSKDKNKNVKSILPLCLAIVTLFFSSEISKGVYSGMLFSVSCLIPTLFPFFIISDMILSFGLPFIRRDRAPFAEVILLGLLCGFPHGTRAAGSLFNTGAITEKEYGRLVALSSSPSLAFVIAGVGAGMLKSGALGVILYASLCLSVPILSLAFKKGKPQCEKFTYTRKAFSLVESIKGAAFSSISVASFVIFFYGVLAFVSCFVKNEAVILILSLALEIGSGCQRVSTACVAPVLKMGLLGFTLGFSSLSVFMQELCFAEKALNKKRMLLLKLFRGLLVGLIAILLTFIYKKWLFL